MTKDKLFMAIGEIDPVLVETAFVAGSKKKRKPLLFRPPFLAVAAAVAACLVLVVALGNPLLGSVPQIRANPGFGMASPMEAGEPKEFNYNGNRYKFSANGSTYDFSEFTLRRALGTLQPAPAALDENVEEPLPTQDLSTTFLPGAVLYEIPGYNPAFRVAVAHEGSFYLAELVGKADGTPVKLSYYAGVSNLEKMLDSVHLYNTLSETTLQKNEAQRLLALILDSPIANLSAEEMQHADALQDDFEFTQCSVSLKDGTWLTFIILDEMQVVKIGNGYYELSEKFAEEYSDLIK